MLDTVRGSEALGDKNKKKPQKTKNPTWPLILGILSRYLNTKEQIIIYWIRKAVIKEVQNAMQTCRGLIKSRLGVLEKAFQEITTSIIKSEGKEVISESKVRWRWVSVVVRAEGKRE